MAPLETAIRDLREMLSADRTSPEWRWQVRRTLKDVKKALGAKQTKHWDAWLAARAHTSNRDRRQLQARVSALAAMVLDRLDTEGVARELARLTSDLEHHLQRMHDLVYDSVSLELGGSE